MKKVAVLMAMDISVKGQVFTPDWVVEYMVSLIRNDGFILEPSCGDGAFLYYLPKDRVTAIEKEEGLCQLEHLNIDFFDYRETKIIKTIIGNPPYVRYQDILADTKHKLDHSIFDKRSNLYLFFISRCVDILDIGGELIFVTPRDFLKQTSAKRLNKKLFELGGFTHFNDFGDNLLFKGVSPNCAIWRWQKGRQNSQLDNGGYMSASDGQIVFVNEADAKRLSGMFDVKVGAVSGADHIFEQEENKKSTDFVCSRTYKEGILRKMLYNTYDRSLTKHKNELLSRKIRAFDDSNWWQWGRKYPHKEGERIYVNCKTRYDKPFYVSDVPAYDGSILALFPKVGANVHELCNSLNDVDWNSLGFKCGGRYLFSQRTLEGISVNL